MLHIAARHDQRKGTINDRFVDRLQRYQNASQNANFLSNKPIAKRGFEGGAP
jgi:hypothetical protein